MRYILPTDDAALDKTGATASVPDTGYPADNLFTENPAEPAKLAATSGTFTLPDLGDEAILGFILVYHNLDEALGVNVTTGGFTASITIDEWFNLRDSRNAIVIFDSPQVATGWTLNITGTNTQNVTIGRLIAFTAINVMEDDLEGPNSFKWDPAAVIEEEQPDIMVETEAKVRLGFALGSFIRSLTAEFGARSEQAETLAHIRRNVYGRITPWIILPWRADAPYPDEPLIVTFMEPKWTRALVAPDYNLIPFAVIECARGVLWP